jgi:hypothetical protein
MHAGRSELTAYIETEARALARSGKYRGHREIQRILMEMDYASARKVFQNRWTQSELDRICHNAWTAGLPQSRGLSEAA